MANASAFQMGWDLAGGKKKQGDDKTQAGGGQQAPGGLAALIQKGVGKLRGKMRGNKPAGGAAAATDESSPTLPQNQKRTFTAPLAPALNAGLKGFKKGGPVKKTGVYMLHKNEYVVPAPRRSPTSKRGSSKRTVVKM